MLLISGKEIAENCENPFDIWEEFFGKMLVRECPARQNVFTWQRKQLPNNLVALWDKATTK
jgi:hypothetical protein